MKRRRIVLLLLVLVLLSAGLLRVFNTGHSLLYDEAWNANTVADGATGHTQETRISDLAPDNWFGNYYRHPPVYLSLGIAYAFITGSGRYGASIALEIFSMMSAVALAYVIFLCGRDWFSDYAGLAAAFLFAVTPAARMLDSVVKADPLTLLFVMLFLLYFFRKRYWLGGLMLGFAFLTKEVAIFVPGALLVFIGLKRRWPEMKGLLESAAMAIVTCFWWYLFLSSTSGEFSDFFFGRSVESVVWHKSWSYYVTRLSADWGWPILLICLLGLVMALSFKGKDKEPRSDGFTAREHAQFVLLVCLVVYGVLTLSYGKPPWMIYSALPAAALLGGWALAETATRFSPPRVAVAGVALVLAAALALSVPVGFGGFMKRADKTYQLSISDRRIAGYVNSKAGGNGTITMKVSDLTPAIAFYLDSYRPGSMVKVPGDCRAGDGSLKKYTMFLLYEDTTLDGLLHIAGCASPRYVLVRGRTGQLSKPGEPFTALDVSRITPAVFVNGNAALFDGRKLKSAAVAGRP